MHKNSKTPKKMFYSTQLLTLGTRTELSTLYYISTTNNAFKKIPKNRIESIDILEIVKSIKEPQNPFSLRLYSFLVRGIVKVFILKLKYCEGDLNVIINSFLKEKKIVASRKPKETKIVLTVDKIEPFNKEIVEYEMTSVECQRGVMSSNTFNDEMICPAVDDFMEITSQISIKRRKTERSDKHIEIDVSKLTINMRETVKIIIPCVFEEFDKFIRNSKRNQLAVVEQNSFEVCEYDVDSVETIRNASSSILKQFSTVEDLEMFDEVGEIKLEDFIDKSSFNFNKEFENIGKTHKSVLFYELLEMVCAKKAIFYQDGPYYDIHVTLNCIR